MPDGPSEPLLPSRAQSAVQSAHARSAAEIAELLKVDVAHGLSNEDIRQRFRRFGPNILARHAAKSVWTIVLGQVRSFAVILLTAAAVLSLTFGEIAESLAIFVVLIINTLVGFYTEWRAVRSMEALHRLGRITARARRNGSPARIDSRGLVPGDVILLKGGDVITADIRLTTVSGLQCDESTLTGESVPIAKTTGVLTEPTGLADRTNMAFRGTAVTRGTGEGVVVATGMASELGRIAALAQSAESELTPLERRLDRLTVRLIWFTLAIVAAIGAFGALAGRDLVAMLETTVALAVAAVPEGLPIVATITLARGMWRMARRNALIERLSAVETLGATTVILTDKTGTLTQNRMGVSHYLLHQGEAQISHDHSQGAGFSIDGEAIEMSARPALVHAVRIGVLCTEEAEDGRDPMETALINAGAESGLAREDALETAPLIGFHEFDPALKMMATVHSEGATAFAAVKGAPEAVVERADAVLTADGPAPLASKEKAQWLERVEHAASSGYRVLALAENHLATRDADPYQGLTLVAMVCLIDPVRADVPQAIGQCLDAGVRVVMLTGDHAATADAIARQAGLGDEDAPPILGGAPVEGADLQGVFDATIFARVSPETKLRLVSLYQERGDIVAMTGDGVNDAPALRKADIGIAMGERGTEVAREAAAMVLKDDSFASIVSAIREGRVIFNNIRRFVVYLLSCNVSEILVVGLATLAGLPLPLLPLQVLYLNLVTDVFPAFAVAMGEGPGDVMRSPPRDPARPILERRQWSDIAVLGALITAATLGAFVAARLVLELSPEQATTVSFATIAFAQLWNVFNMRDRRETALSNTITLNPYVWGALLVCIILIAAPVYLTTIGDVLGLARLGPEALLLVAGASLAPLFLGQLYLGRRAAED